MTTVTMHEAKTHLSKLIARVEAGEEIVIARGKEPVAKLSALPRARQRVFGSLKGKYPMPPDSFFFDPLPGDELKLWEGGDDEDPARWPRPGLVGNPRCKTTTRKLISRPFKR